MAERFRVDPDKVVHETIEGEAILIHLDNGFYYSLDGTGAEIWGLLAGSRSVDETAGALAHEYDSDEIAAEVRRIADELVAENLLEPTDLAPAVALNGDAPAERRAFTAPGAEEIRGYAGLSSRRSHPRDERRRVARDQAGPLSPARDYFGEVRDAAEEAAERAGGWIERDLRIADATLRLRFAGPALLDAFYGPIAHLEVDSVEDPVTISLFDSATTGTEYPTVPWSRESLDPRGHVREPVGDGITAYHLVHFGAITLFDAASRTGLLLGRVRPRSSPGTSSARRCARRST